MQMSDSVVMSGTVLARGVCYFGLEPLTSRPPPRVLSRFKPSLHQQQANMLNIVDSTKIRSTCRHKNGIVSKQRSIGRKNRST